MTVVTGFVAGDGHSGTVTLGRGASDLTATVLANFLDAEAVEIWSDVDGLLAAPPRWVPEASPLPALSYAEAAGLARFGADVLHPGAVAPVAAAGIPLWIRNTLNPSAPGTRIEDRRDPAGVRAVTLVPSAPWRGREAALVAVIGGGEPRTAVEMSEALGRLEIEPLGWITSEPSALVAVVDGEDGPPAVRGLHQILVRGRNAPLAALGTVAGAAGRIRLAARLEAIADRKPGDIREALSLSPSRTAT